MFDPSNDYTLLVGRLPEPGTKEILVTDYLIASFNYFNLYPNCSTYYDYLNRELKVKRSNVVSKEIYHYSRRAKK